MGCPCDKKCFLKNTSQFELLLKCPFSDQSIILFLHFQQSFVHIKQRFRLSIFSVLGHSYLLGAVVEIK